MLSLSARWSMPGRSHVAIPRPRFPSLSRLPFFPLQELRLGAVTSLSSRWEPRRKAADASCKDGAFCHKLAFWVGTGAGGRGLSVIVVTVGSRGLFVTRFPLAKALLPSPCRPVCSPRLIAAPSWQPADSRELSFQMPGTRSQVGAR